MSVVQYSTNSQFYYVNIKMKFGKRVKELRRSEGISQETLAHLSDIDRTYIQSIEKGERNVSILIAERISKTFKITMSELMKGL